MSQHGHHGQSIGPYTPSGQVRLTNVAYVRLQSHGHRFEIACYRNKVLSWRNKIETDINEVLQIATVYDKVSRGILASTEHLMEVFGTTDQLECCKKILDRGEMQVTEQEREALVESTLMEVVAIVADKSVNPETKKPYTTSMIQDAMRQAHINVVTSKSVKAQALDVIRKLKEVMPIARASMALRVVSPLSEDIVVRGKLSDDLGLLLLKETKIAEMVYFEIRIDPEMYRKIEEMVQIITNGKGRVEVTQFRDSAPPALNPNAAVNAVVMKEKEAASRKESTVAAASGGGSGKSKGVVGGGGKKSISFRDGDGSVARPEKLESNSNNDSDDANDDVEDSVFNVEKKLGGGISSKQASDSSDTKAGNKKSKSKKRYEKEEMKEKEKRLNIIRERVKEDQARSGSSQANESPNNNGDDVTVNSVSASSESSSTSAAPLAPASSNTSTTAAGGGQRCNTCGGLFPDATAYRNHFRSEWHRHNLKRKMKNLPVISSEEDFLKLPIEELEI